MADLEDLTPEMKAAIGRESAPVVHEVTTLGIRTFARAVGYTNPVYYDIDAAKAKGHRDLLSPPGYYGMPVYHPGAATGGEEDPGAGLFTRRLNGGTEVEPVQDVYAGDVLDAVTRVTELQLRQSRLGQMLVRVAETVYTRQSDGVVVGRIRNTGLRY
ncbi:MAG: MaoC family dehydratase N-terminal domain-containing protein [Dehalococcoidia bacterium]